MPQPLCEVFGYPVDNFSPEAIESRKQKLCPFNNKYPVCTKDKKLNPLGVCSIKEGEPIIICPVRFRQDWTIIKDTSRFLVPDGFYDFVTEVKLVDADEESVGKIDVVLFDNTDLSNFGALEVQAVYISGNVRNPFEAYYQSPETMYGNPWTGPNYPGPDWLSSIKRLEHQLIMKGTLLNLWGKKMAVAVQSEFYDNFRTLQRLPEVPEREADMGWFLYNLVPDTKENGYNLVLERTVYCRLDKALERFSQVSAGQVDDFISVLDKKYKAKLRAERSQRGKSTPTLYPFD